MIKLIALILTALAVIALVACLKTTCKEILLVIFKGAPRAAPEVVAHAHAHAHSHSHSHSQSHTATMTIKYLLRFVKKIHWFNNAINSCSFKVGTFNFSAFTNFDPAFSP